MTRHISYNYCGICGRVPETNLDEPNWAPVRWWDPDDGWKIGTLCRWCLEEYQNVKPKTTDFAWRSRNEFAAEENINTDEDPAEALDELAAEHENDCYDDDGEAAYGRPD